jgi:hypothetical protein
MFICRHDETFKRVKCRTVHGHWQLRMQCIECGEVYGKALPQFGVNMRSIPEFCGGVEGGVKCDVVGCECTETALHHMMPRAMGLDSDKWPTARLCREHHSIWHAVVTPDLCRKGWSG